MNKLLLIIIVSIYLFGCVTSNIVPLKHEWLKYRNSIKNWYEISKHDYYKVIPIYKAKSLGLLTVNKIIRLSEMDVKKYTGKQAPPGKKAYLVRALTCKINQTGGLSVYSNTVTKEIALQYSALGNCTHILKEGVVVFLANKPVNLYVELNLAR